MKLKDIAEGYANSSAAFNTFIKLKNIETINIFDFCLNLYLEMGIKIEAAPYFGLDQKAWEQNKNLGFWLRVTYALDTELIKESIKKILNFKNSYMDKKTTYIHTNLEF